ncbi:hypothetical protein OS493_030199 [Desmophyllum pertusum]|uniref:Uncharacterized protein n=1 Tax=Desmophyllum pertusum TaxID=174260 RepID=A0A9W9YJY8_9CNID|nr:hypothetical protein OS493_030199 [Desmophyllum pertusum]
MAAARVLVYGGRGALGGTCVSYFKSKDWADHCYIATLLHSSQGTQSLYDMPDTEPTTSAPRALTFTSNFPIPSPMNVKGDPVNNWEFFRQQWTDGRSRHKPRQARTEDSPGYISFRTGQGMSTDISQPETQPRGAK